VRRLVIDGLASFFEAALSTERVGRFFACLINELRARGVTVMTMLETRDAVGSVVPTPYGVSALVDNLIFLRYAEVDGELRRLMSILKIRGSGFDPGVRALDFSHAGIVVRGRFTEGGDIVPTARPVAGGDSVAALDDPRRGHQEPK
jgi:circadian clock protein KaiC